VNVSLGLLALAVAIVVAAIWIKQGLLAIARGLDTRNAMLLHLGKQKGSRVPVISGDRRERT
jgi:hypothetical protein